MTVIDKAVDWAVAIANEAEHGYDQTFRWGEYGDYDCSSFVITAYKLAGVPLSCTYTGNMKQDMLRNGFKLVTDCHRQAGDILLNELHHTAMMIDETHLVQASQNEWGGVTGGMPGDQTGGEINIRTYYDFPWDCVLRYSPAVDCASIPEELPDTYTVKAGDTMYGIALKYGMNVMDIANLNGIKDPSLIWVGQVLKLKEEEADECEACKVVLPEVSEESSSTEVYTIQPGDTLSGIAFQRYGRWSYYQQLAWYNHLTNPHTIQVGQQIKLPPIEELLK